MRFGAPQQSFLDRWHQFAKLIQLEQRGLDFGFDIISELCAPCD